MPELIIENFHVRDYTVTLKEMQHFTDTRDANTIDRLWTLQHPPVFTQGQAGKAEHILDAGDIPIVQSDRGGQVTYHGPGQVIIYLMLDLKRLGLGIRSLVCAIEQSVIACLADYDIKAESRRDAPGVYVAGAKICSLGLRVRKGYSYHGLALNTDMDLSPFQRINPCGYQGLSVTQVKDCVNDERIVELNAVKQQLTKHLLGKLGYTSALCDPIA